MLKPSNPWAERLPQFYTKVCKTVSKTGRMDFLFFLLRKRTLNIFSTVYMLTQGSPFISCLDVMPYTYMRSPFFPQPSLVSESLSFTFVPSCFLTRSPLLFPSVSFATVGVCSSWQRSTVCLMWFPEVLNCSPWPLFLSSVDLLSL